MSTRELAPSTLVFIHGPFLGPWSWTETVMPVLQARGLRCFAPDLQAAWPAPPDSAPPHAWWSGVASLPLSRYVDRLHGVLSDWSGTKILIGHSMGARIVEGLVAKGHRDGVVMIAPTPPEGLSSRLRGLARHHPADAVRTLLTRRPLRLFGPPGHPDPGRVGRWLLHPGASAAQCEALAGRLRDESFAACRDWLGPSPWPADPDVPALMIGGREDALVAPADIRRTAVAWRANARIVPHAGHCPQLGETGVTLARHIERWLFE